MSSLHNSLPSKLRVCNGFLMKFWSCGTKKLILAYDSSEGKLISVTAVNDLVDQQKE